MPGESAFSGSVSGKTGAALRQTIGQAFTVMVNAVDANWNVVSSTDTVAITASDADATLPANASLVAGNQSFRLTLWRSATVTANDVTAGAIAANTGPLVEVGNAPTLDASKNPTLTAQDEDSGAPSGPVGTLVSSLVDFADPVGQVDNVTDADSGALLGIAVTGADTSNGIWFWSTNGGSTWSPLGVVTTSNSRLLAADAKSRLYFQPHSDHNGIQPSAITFRAWDQTSGGNGGLADTSINGDTTAFSSETDTASLVINAVNDAPVSTSGSVNNLTVLEDSGCTSLGFEGLAFSPGGGLDEAGQVLICQVTVVPSSSFGSIRLADGATSVSFNSVYSLSQLQGMQFCPATNANGMSFFGFNVVDSGGTANGGINASPFFVQLNVTPVNDAPVVTATATTLASTENAPATPIDPGLTVTDVDNSNLVGATATISANFVKSQDALAFINQSGITGAWNSGAGVLTLTGSATKAKYQTALRSVSYLNTCDAPSTLTRTVSFVVNDGLTNSLPAVRAISVAAANDAPVLSGANSFTAIRTDQTNSNGNLVADLIVGQITDADSSPLSGLAVIAVNSGDGTWQYSTDNGSLWNRVGLVTANSALLPRTDDKLRFVPGTVASTFSITFRAWDQTSGGAGDRVDTTNSGGTTAFSTNTASSSLTVNKGNQTITFSAISDQLTANTVAFDATASSGLAVSYSVTSGPGSLTSSTNFTCAGPGSVTITASQAGDSNWNAASDVSRSFNVNSLPVPSSPTVERWPLAGVKVHTSVLLGTDPDGDTIRLLSAGPISAQGVPVSTNQTWVYYTPPAGFTESDFYPYAVSDSHGGVNNGTVTIHLNANSKPTENYLIEDLGNGAVIVHFSGIPGRTYAIHFSDSAAPANWQALSTRVADASGAFMCVDTPRSHQASRYYRATHILP